MKQTSIIIILSALLLPSCMNEPAQQPNTYNGNFEALWQIINTKYCYLDYKHINISTSKIYLFYGGINNNFTEKLSIDYISDHLLEHVVCHSSRYQDRHPYPENRLQ